MRALKHKLRSFIAYARSRLVTQFSTSESMDKKLVIVKRRGDVSEKR